MSLFDTAGKERAKRKGKKPKNKRGDKIRPKFQSVVDGFVLVMSN